MTHTEDLFQRFSILKEFESFRKFWVFWNFQNWSSFNELKWTKSIDGHSRQIQVRIQKSKISTTQSKLKDFPNPKTENFKHEIISQFAFSTKMIWKMILVNISPEISLILRKLHIGIKSWVVLNTICEFLIAMGVFFRKLWFLCT